jgi:hypothetical protein
MKKKLIYILGAGRSGTTILDIVLGNVPKAISLGEINRFFKREGLAPKRDPSSEVGQYWERVRNTFENQQFEPVNYDRLQRLTYSNEYHTSFPKIFFSKANKNYSRLMRSLYDSIQQESLDYDLLIESSKYPNRAINLSRQFGKEFDIGYIYLKKDPVKVVDSFAKKGLEQPSKSYFASNIYYFAVNFLCYLTVLKLRRRRHKVHILKYEDLIQDPIEVLDQIGELFQLNVDTLKASVDQNQNLNTGYLFDGNRIRLNQTIVLQKGGTKASSKGASYYFTRIFNYLIYN